MILVQTIKKKFDDLMINKEFIWILRISATDLVFEMSLMWSDHVWFRFILKISLWLYFLSTTLMFYSARTGASLCTCNQSPLEGDEVTEKHLFFILIQGNGKNCWKTGTKKKQTKKKTSGGKHFRWREHLRMWFDFRYLVEV